jgi:glutathione S-transferase
LTAVLWHIELSYYNEKARWALDYEAVPHVRRAPLPGLHGAYALALTRGTHRRLPVLELDGRRTSDSTAIIAALEAFRPDPPLYPSDAAERARALALEDFFDERLAPAVRRYAWFHTLPDVDATVDAVMPNASPSRKRIMRSIVPAVRRSARTPPAPRVRAPALIDLREELARRPGGAWVAEMYARHRGSSAEVAA